MLVALERFDLRIPGCRSLKQKRHVLTALTAALRQRFPVSVAEVEHQDLWQRTAIAVAAVSGQGYHVKKVVHEVERHVERFPSVEVIDRVVRYVGEEDL